ncbi:MAG: capsule biosynthesis protein [Pseudomonadota bacterium]
MSPPRTVLLLQGPSSRFFAHLARALETRGARALRVHLAPGDVLFGGRRGRSFRGRAQDWSGWLAALIRAEGVTDLALLGDSRPLHRTAIETARRLSVRVHHVELGHLRPDLLSVEPDGAGPASSFPSDWPGVEALARGPLPDPQRRWPASFARYAAMDVAWNLSNLALARLTHPAYRRHAIWHPLAEYGGFLWKWTRAPADRAHARRAWTRCPAGEAPLFLFPLQLRTDHQIRVHGPHPDLRETAREVVQSFAAHAPPGARLLVKEHPMDNALTPWRRLLRRAAARSGAADRVEVIDGGDLDAMIARSAGVVTVNSTVGLSALRAGRPVKALGRAIFDREGLTDPRPLSAFWTAPRPPDPGRVETFLRALAWSVLVPGSFDGPGALPGAANVAERILRPRLPFRDAPPP